jgi:predicted TIM-barrel fold metal-dependent hydrolase
VAERPPASEPFEPIARGWLDAIAAQRGPLAFFDAHTHIGRNDPDGFKQEPAALLATLERAGARAVCFPMHEPGGYARANDEVLAVSAASGGRIVAFCRVNPHEDAPAEARRCLDAGARGIKLHPRAEGFAMDHPAIEPLVALAAERGVAVLIHAGRGIPALGRDTLALAARHPRARLILAHAAVSDLAWLWRAMPEHPNVLIDTSWWNPADLIALFSLVPPGQIVWASDSPYGHPVGSAAIHMRCAIAAGLDDAALACVAGAQIARVVAGAPLADAGPAPGPSRAPLAPAFERVCSHLLAAIGTLRAAGDPSEAVALARLALDPAGEHLVAVAELDRLLELAQRLRGEPPPPGRRFPPAMQLVIAALCLARTPQVVLPER